MVANDLEALYGFDAFVHSRGNREDDLAGLRAEWHDAPEIKCTANNCLARTTQPNIQNIKQQDSLYTKTGGRNESYDAYYIGSDPVFVGGNGEIEFSAGEVETHKRLVLSTQPEQSRTSGEVMIGMFIKSRMHIASGSREIEVAYSTNDVFSLKVVDGRIVLYRNASEEVASFNLPSEPIYASMWFYETGASMRVDF